MVNLSQAWYPSTTLKHVPLSTPQLQSPQSVGHVPNFLQLLPHSRPTLSPQNNLCSHFPEKTEAFKRELPQCPAPHPNLACLPNFLPLQPALLRGRCAPLVKG